MTTTTTTTAVDLARIGEEITWPAAAVLVALLGTVCFLLWLVLR